MSVAHGNVWTPDIMPFDGLPDWVPAPSDSLSVPTAAQLKHLVGLVNSRPYFERILIKP